MSVFISSNSFILVVKYIGPPKLVFYSIKQQFSFSVKTLKNRYFYIRKHLKMSQLLKRPDYVSYNVFALYIMKKISSMFLCGQAVSWVVGLTLVATPLGRVILIGAGLTAGYIGAVGGDFIGRELATGAYNASSKRLSL